MTLLTSLLACAMLATGAATSVLAQATPTPAAVPEPAAAIAPDVRPTLLAANTVVELQLVEPISSKTNKPGDFFKLHTLAEVKVGDVVVIPTGAAAVGQVVHAQKAGGGGKAGELILAARYIDTPLGQIKLHSGFGAAGQSRVGASLATSIAFGVIGFVVKGKEIELPSGFHLLARTSLDTPINSKP